jgi:ATP-dependent Clp protease adaptor protein ClpS
MAAMAKLGQHGSQDAIAEEVVASDAFPLAIAHLGPKTLERRVADRSSGYVPSSPRGMAERRKGTPGDGSGTALLTKTRTRTKRPNMYRVLLLNDDYTPMEFVVHVLEQFFNKSREEATRIMLHVHQNGVGECGVFTYEVAETKVTQVMDFARKHQHPLQCVMEKK